MVNEGPTAAAAGPLAEVYMPSEKMKSATETDKKTDAETKAVVAEALDRIEQGGGEASAIDYARRIDGYSKKYRVRSF
jgi:hypothetical protein